MANLGGNHTVCIKEGKILDIWDSTEGETIGLKENKDMAKKSYTVTVEESIVADFKELCKEQNVN